MLPINYDHSDLVKQLCDVGRQFSRCKTVEERFLVYETYLGLVDSYFTATGKEYCNKKLYRSFVKEGENFFFEVCASNFNNFVINKDFHANLMLSCYAQLDSFFQDFCESSYCGRLEKKKLSPINEEIDEDCALLMKFFREEAPELCSLYQMVVDSGNLYAMGEDDWLREGLSIFNLVQKKANVFVSPSNPSFKELSLVPHELGHVEEFRYFLDYSPVMDTLRYFASGCLSEVVSTYYEQLFLEFYINHGNRRDDALLSMVNHFEKGLNDIWDSYVLALLPKKSLEEIKDTNVELSSTETELMELGLLSPSWLSEEDRIISVGISPIYAYGFLLANYFLEHPDSYTLFQEKKNQSFSPEFLESLGITTESLSKTLVKRGERLFGRYMD